jgi:hypothetical protein
MTVLGQRLETNFRHGVAEGLRHPVAGLWKVSTSRSPVPLQITDLPSTPWPDPDNRLVWFKMRPKVGDRCLLVSQRCCRRKRGRPQIPFVNGNEAVTDQQNSLHPLDACLSTNISVFVEAKELDKEKSDFVSMCSRRMWL